MEYLHNNQQLFSDVLNACSEDTGIARAILEKDYCVSIPIKLPPNIFLETKSGK